MQIEFKFINQPTKDFFNCTKRNSCLSGGYGSGKTYVACMKILFLSLAFDNYRTVIARLEYQALKKTTLATFLKICPPTVIKQWNPQDGVMTLINGSQILWMHLDTANERTLRGLEINSVFLDQPEELVEQIYNTLNARIGRWDKAIPTKATLKQFGYQALKDWPTDEKTGNLKIPSYMMLTPNPDSETHWIWRIYHPDSPESAKKLANHEYFEVSSVDNPMLPQETLDIMLANDASWVSRFVHGKWGISEATIHMLFPQSKLQVSKEWIENLLNKSALYRVLDHGETAPTCMTWWAVHKNFYYCYREYYMPRRVISYHRTQIEELSKGEKYICDWSDPQMFKMTTQKYGGHWSVADEYREVFPAQNIFETPPAPIFFQPADNAELATRNRINEGLALRESNIHPVTGQNFSPNIYFIEKNPGVHSYGCEHLQIQIRAQRRVKLAEIEGRPIFSDEREKSVEDHSYDTFRYFVAMHPRGRKEEMRKPPLNSFLAARNSAKVFKTLTNSHGDRKTVG